MALQTLLSELSKPELRAAGQSVLQMDAGLLHSLAARGLPGTGLGPDMQRPRGTGRQTGGPTPARSRPGSAPPSGPSVGGGGAPTVGFAATAYSGASSQAFPHLGGAPLASTPAPPAGPARGTTAPRPTPHGASPTRPGPPGHGHGDGEDVEALNLSLSMISEDYGEGKAKERGDRGRRPQAASPPGSSRRGGARPSTRGAAPLPLSPSGPTRREEKGSSPLARHPSGGALSSGRGSDSSGLSPRSSQSGRFGPGGAGGGPGGKRDWDSSTKVSAVNNNNIPSGSQLRRSGDDVIVVGSARSPRRGGDDVLSPMLDSLDEFFVTGTGVPAAQSTGGYISSPSQSGSLSQSFQSPAGRGTGPRGPGPGADTSVSRLTRRRWAV